MTDIGREGWRAWARQSFKRCSVLTIGYSTITGILSIFAILVGIYLYNYVMENQQMYFDNMFDDMHQAITEELNRYQYTVRSVAGIFSVNCPNASQWPYCGVSLELISAMGIPLLGRDNLQGLAMLPMVHYDNLTQFEEWAYEYISTGGFPEGTGYSPDGFGVFMKNPQDPSEQYHTTANYSFSEYPFLLFPVILQVPIQYTYRSIMYDIHSQVIRANAIDALIEKSRRPVPILNESHVTDIIQLVQDIDINPAALLMYPVYAANDPLTMVGVVDAVFHWGLLLTAALPTNYGEGIMCRIRTNTQTVWFVMTKEGVLLSQTQYPTTKYHSATYSIGCDGCNVYEITFYPPNDIEGKYSSPVAASLAAVAVVSLLMLALTAFYVLALRLTEMQRNLLESKRAYVRFISHEVRTPMNTIALGLGLLTREFDGVQRLRSRSQLSSTEDSDISEQVTVPISGASIVRWIGLVNDIRENAGTAVDVLSDLLEYDKIESNTLTLNFKPVEMKRLIESVMKGFAPQAAEKTIQLLLEYDTSSYMPLRSFYLWGDRAKLSQVLRNLISNALKFSPAESNVSIKVSFVRGTKAVSSVSTLSRSWLSQQPEVPSPHKVMNDYGAVIIAIGDSGAGISLENQRKLFLKGIQFNPDKLQAGNGSGLGLFIARGIATLHGGDIKASSPGENLGSEFELLLPLYVEDSPGEVRGIVDDRSEHSDSNSIGSQSEHSPRSPNLHKKMALTELEQLSHASTSQPSDDINSTALTDSNSSVERAFAGVNTVLIVDDASSNRRMLSRLLKIINPDLVLSEAPDGQVAIDMVREAHSTTPFDLILMDFEMPVMNGPDATQIIRRDCHVTSLIIGVTGNALQSDIDYFMSRGTDAVLPKPLSVEKLDDVVKKLLAKKAAAAASSAALAIGEVVAPPSSRPASVQRATTTERNDQQV